MAHSALRRALPMVALLLAASSVVRAAPVRITHLTTDAAADPLGIDDATPRLAWRLESTGRGVRQAAFRILVASRPEAAREGAADVWDSGRVAAGDPWGRYARTALRSRTP